MKKALFPSIAAGLLLTACSHGGGPPGGMPGGFAMPVSASPVSRGTIAQTFSVTGTVTPLQAASLSSVASGNVLLVGAQIGQHVHKGDLLVQIDDSTLRASLQSAEATLEAARAHLAQTQASASGDVAASTAGVASARASYRMAQLTLQRNQTLLKEGYVSQSAVDQAWQQQQVAQAQLRDAEVASQNAALTSDSPSAAQANIKNAKAAVDQAAGQVALIAAQLAQTSVLAPFDGTVASRNVDPGSLAAPGTTLMEVAQLDPVFINVGISGEDLNYVRVGTPVTVTVGAIAGRAWHGNVAYLSMAAVPGTVTYQARIPIANPDSALRGGMIASVSFEQGHRNGVIVAPRAAVFQTDTGFGMFIIDAGKAKSIPVTVGLQNDKQMEVSGPGLKPGVMAILNHPATLQPGMPVMVLPAQGQQQHA